MLIYEHIFIQLKFMVLSGCGMLIAQIIMVPSAASLRIELSDILSDISYISNCYVILLLIN